MCVCAHVCLGAYVLNTPKWWPDMKKRTSKLAFILINSDNKQRAIGEQNKSDNKVMISPEQKSEEGEG